jgi:hypothetical protein
LCELIEEYTEKKSGEDCVIIDGAVPQSSQPTAVNTRPASVTEPSLVIGLLLLPVAGLIFSKESKKPKE